MIWTKRGERVYVAAVRTLSESPAREVTLTGDGKSWELRDTWASWGFGSNWPDDARRARRFALRALRREHCLVGRV